MSINGWIDKENVIYIYICIYICIYIFHYIYTYILFNFKKKKEEILSYANMDEPGEHYAK